MLEGIYTPYHMWEHWTNGLFSATLREGVVGECVNLLMSPEAFRLALQDVANDWPHATAQHLSNLAQNHQPWCGRLACGYEHGATIREVNVAWFELGHEDQAQANRVADSFTAEWRATNMKGQLSL